MKKIGDNNYRISVATAGFNQDQLEINLENKVLTITGKVVEEENDPNVEYLYKGIASRSFKLSLRLDGHVEVQQADYDNGLLTIDLKRNVPERRWYTRFLLVVKIMNRYGESRRLNNKNSFLIRIEQI